MKFTQLSQSKNPIEYSRQYVDEPFQETDITGYSPSIAYAFDYHRNCEVQKDIVAITEGEFIGDEMAKTASKANTSVGQLGEAILTVGGTAKSLAGGTTELNAALGVLANRGIKGSEGGTAPRNIILALSAPTDKAAQALDGLGVSAFDADGNLRPLNEIFRDLDSALAGMSEGDKTLVLNEIFNKVDLKSAQAMLIQAIIDNVPELLAAALTLFGAIITAVAEIRVKFFEAIKTAGEEAIKRLADTLFSLTLLRDFILIRFGAVIAQSGR